MMMPPKGGRVGTDIFLLEPGIDQPISLVLKGPSHTGKTSWARSFGQNNYIFGHLDLNPITFRNDVHYNVIDDVTPHYIKFKYQK